LYQRYALKLDPPMRQNHKAGEKLFVDYAGDTVPITDPESGEERQAQIFVATMGASSYTYAGLPQPGPSPTSIVIPIPRRSSFTATSTHTPAPAIPPTTTVPVSTQVSILSTGEPTIAESTLISSATPHSQRKGRTSCLSFHVWGSY